MALRQSRTSTRALMLLILACTALLWSVPAATARVPSAATADKFKAHFSNQVAMDVSPPLSSLSGRGGDFTDEDGDIREEAGPEATADAQFHGDGAVQPTAAPAAIPG